MHRYTRDLAYRFAMPINVKMSKRSEPIKESCDRRTGALRGRRSTAPQPLGIGGLRPLRFGADELSHERPRSLGAVRESLPLRQDGVPCVRNPLAADSMHAVHPGFLSAIAQIHPATARSTSLDSLVRVPAYRRAQRFGSRQIAAGSSPAESNPCVRRKSDGRRHRPRSKCLHLHFETSRFPASHAEVHQEQRECALEAILCPASYVSSCSSTPRKRFSRDVDSCPMPSASKVSHASVRPDSHIGTEPRSWACRPNDIA